MDAELVYTKNTAHIAARLSRECMLPLFHDNVRIFGNSELTVSVPKKFHDVVLLASTIDNNDWMELFLLLDALRTADNVYLCMPYCSYGRQNHYLDNESCGAEVTQRLIENFSNIRRCVFVDRHTSPTIRIPTTHLHAGMVFAEDIRVRYNNIVVVSPDLGGVERAADVAQVLRVPLVICNKHKDILGGVRKIDVIGDVRNKNCIIVDDIVDSGATLCYAAEALISQGANCVSAYVTHGLLNSVENIEKSIISEVVLSDSVAHTGQLSEKFRIVSLISLLVGAIRSILP